MSVMQNAMGNTHNDPFDIRDSIPYESNARQLIALAGSALRSFYLSRADAGTSFEGFVRDSLIQKQDLSFSTGSLGVLVQLFELEPYFEFLEQNGFEQLVADLRHCRERSVRFTFESPRPRLKFGFGFLNP